MKQYDAIMIGFGKGSKTLAAEFAKRGMQVAMIERSDQMYGGTCINEGCIPSKSLIMQVSKYDYATAVNHKETLVTKLRKKNFDKLNQFENVDIYTAKASFVNAHEVRMSFSDHEEIILGKQIFINTGSTPRIPTIQGIHKVPHIYTSAELMKQTVLPKKLAILGGGYIGLEFSSMYARYGSSVTVFEQGSRLVKREDEDVAGEIQAVLKAQGINFIFESEVTAFEQIGEQVKVHYLNQKKEKQELLVDGVLLAAGRSANTKELHLENAGVEVDRYGNIIVDETLHTTMPHIFAMGDVKGGLQFTYISLDDSRIIKDQLFGKKQRTIHNRGAIPYSVFITPTFSRVGLSEAEAIAQGHKIKVKKLPVAAIPRANVNGQTQGIFKAIIDTENDEILGCALFSTASEEMINFVQLAIHHHISATEIANHIFTHPSMSEALNDLFGL